MRNIDEALELIKAKLGFDVEKAVVAHEWCGDTETGFYTEYEVDMDVLNEEIDRFQLQLLKRAE